MKYDIVIPAHEKDIPVLNFCLEGAISNCIGADNIYVISSFQVDHPKVTWIPEKRFPFTAQDIVHRNNIISPNRSGWYLQQLLKLYSFRIIPDLKDTILILDSDTIFLNPTKFNEGKQKYYMGSDEHVGEYFDHMRRLHPQFTRSINASGNIHHAIWEKDIVNEIFTLTEGHHNKQFWECMIDEVKNGFCGHADYEIYLHYVFKFHPKRVLFRNLKWSNNGSLSKLRQFKSEGYNFVSCHAYNEWSRDI